MGDDKLMANVTTSLLSSSCLNHSGRALCLSQRREMVSLFRVLLCSGAIRSESPGLSCCSSVSIVALAHLVHVFIVTRLATREVHLWIDLHLIDLVILSPRSRAFRPSLIAQVVGKLLAKHCETVEVSLGKPIDNALDLCLTVGVFDPFRLEDSYDFVECAFDDVQGIVTHVPLHNHYHLLVKSARLFRLGPVDELFRDLDVKDILAISCCSTLRRINH